jgi:hypothetical protein
MGGRSLSVFRCADGNVCVREWQRGITVREQKHLLHHRSHCRYRHRPQIARPLLDPGFALCRSLRGREDTFAGAPSTWDAWTRQRAVAAPLCRGVPNTATERRGYIRSRDFRESLGLEAIGSVEDHLSVVRYN